MRFLTVKDLKPGQWRYLKDFEIQKQKEPFMKHHFKNNKTGETITSIYNNLDDLKNMMNVNDYERLD